MTAERLKELRMRAGLTQVKLGKRAGIAPNTISQYETGELHFKGAMLETILALAQTLHCSLYELTGIEAAKAFDKPDPEALEMWERYRAMPEGPEKQFIRAKLLQMEPPPDIMKSYKPAEK